MKVAAYIANFFAEQGIRDVFMVTGGGAMHLNDALGHHEKLHCVFNHHEQACAMGAEAYARLTGQLPLVCVTSGPGGTNALTGVLGAWLDSIPMVVVSGQVKRETTVWSTDVPLRQLGDQEYNIIDTVTPMTKYARMVTDAATIRYHLEKALFLATHGRGGPVWLDVPLDIQAANIDPTVLQGFDPKVERPAEEPTYLPEFTDVILSKIKTAKRPVVFAGSGIRLSGGYELFLQTIEKLGIPVVTAWNAHDVLWNEHPLYCGRPGTIGTRGGNFVVQNSDLLLVLGCRLNIRQIGYSYREFAKDAYKIIVDIDPAELQKPTVHADLPICANVRDVMESIAAADYTSLESHQRWLRWCRETDARYPAVLPRQLAQDKPLNPYAFMQTFFEQLQENEIVTIGNGSACVVSFQVANIKRGQRLFTNSGCAAMGYGFPAAIGAAFASPGKRVICIDGDGSFQMNLQEMQTMVHNRLNIKVFYLNNNGYHSIRQTQTNLFQPPFIGIDAHSGISFPDMQKISYAYGVPYFRLDSLADASKTVQDVLLTDGFALCEVILDTTQFFEPKISSKVLPDGRIISPPFDDMFPFLDREEYEKNRDISKI
jgi:acetolactate synthase-1/2/3 large subunit